MEKAYVFEVGDSRLKNGDGKLLRLVTVVPRQEGGLVALDILRNSLEHGNGGTQLQNV